MISKSKEFNIRKYFFSVENVFKLNAIRILGMSISAFVLITLKELLVNSSENVSDISLVEFKKKIQAIEDVVSISVFEPYSSYTAIVKITTSSINSLYKIILGKISKLPQVKETKTMIVIEK